MDKKMFITLLYITSLLPISYMVSQMYFPNRWLIGIGLLNMAILCFLFVFFGTITGTTNQKKKKTWLFLIALFIGAMLFSGLVDNILIRWSLWFHTMMNSTLVVAPSTWDEVWLSWESTIENVSWSVLVIPVPQSPQGTQTGINQTGAIRLESDTDVLTTSKENTIVEDSSSLYSSSSYGSIIPYLVKTYKLKDTDKANPKFTQISSRTTLYSAFATAYSKGMIGTTISPATKVSCDTYLVLKGIAAGRKVSYTGKPFAAYRAEAVSRWEENGCKSWTFVTSTTL